MSDETINSGAQAKTSDSGPDRLSQTESETKDSDVSQATRPSDLSAYPKTPRAAALIAATGLILLAVAALVASGSVALNLRYVTAGGNTGGVVVDTWTRTVAVPEGGQVSIVPMDRNDAKTVPGGLLWGDFDDVPFRTELQYTNGRLYYEFSTEEFTAAIRDAMSYGRGVTFLLTSYAGVPLIEIEANFAEAVRLVDTSSESQEVTGISFSGRVTADVGVWDAIAGVRTQY
jgi:hypothetical protein